LNCQNNYVTFKYNEQYCKKILTFTLSFYIIILMIQQNYFKTRLAQRALILNSFKFILILTNWSIWFILNWHESLTKWRFQIVINGFFDERKSFNFKTFQSVIIYTYIMWNIYANFEYSQKTLLIICSFLNFKFLLGINI